jgi:hypothetical protein
VKELRLTGIHEVDFWRDHTEPFYDQRQNIAVGRLSPEVDAPELLAKWKRNDDRRRELRAYRIPVMVPIGQIGIKDTPEFRIVSPFKFNADRIANSAMIAVGSNYKTCFQVVLTAFPTWAPPSTR